MPSSGLKLVSVTEPEGAVFSAFLRVHHPLSLRFTGALAEAGGERPRIWADAPEEPRLAVLASRGWLTPLGEAEALLQHLSGLDALSAQMPESEGYLKLSALPGPLREVLQSNRRLVRETFAGLYTVTPETFTPFRGGPPVGSVKEADASILAANSPYSEGVDYCLDRIRRAPSAAVRVGGELAAYMVVHANGSIGMLHTMEKHRNRGFGRVVASALVERQFALGREVYCYIVEGNVPSQRVFASLGFRKEAVVSWSAFERPEGAGKGTPGVRMPMA